jgi:hypothetical protein
MRKWPEEIERAIAEAVIRGDRTGAILAGIRDGSLPGLSRAYEVPQRTFYDSLCRVRRRLRDVVAPPETDDTFLRELDAELAAKEASQTEAPEPTPPPDKPEAPTDESSEDVLARVVEDTDALAAEHEDSEQRERGALVEEFRREVEDRPRTISMREALDWQRRLDPPAPRRELPRDPGGYLPDRSREYGRRRP